MGTLFQKMRTVVMGHANDLLDKSIDLNSPSALRQSIRDMEEALAQLQTQAATQAGMIRTLNRKISDAETNIKIRNDAAQKFVDQGKDDMAKAELKKVVALQSSLDGLKNDLVTQSAASTKLDLAVKKLQDKHETILNRLHELERIDGSTKANEQAARAVTAANKVLSGGADISVDDIEDRMRARADIADEKFDRAMSSLDVSEDPEVGSKADDLLNQMKNQRVAKAG